MGKSLLGKRRIKLVNDILKHARDNKIDNGPLLLFLVMCTDRTLTNFHKNYLSNEFKH